VYYIWFKYYYFLFAIFSIHKIGKQKMCLGIPGQIIEITDQNNKLAIVNVAGVKRQINIACIVDDQHPSESCIGDWVLVHVGFAMNRINEQEAKETLQILQEIAEIMVNN
jgi:hydrogenase expression/formation protein HypC